MNSKEKANTERNGRTIGIIPARYGSTRFPGKPLVELSGKPMIEWTYSHANQSKELDALIVATDDKRIYDTVNKFGGKAIMTGNCANGTERCWEVIMKLSDFNLNYDYVINIQGDEPLVNPEHIDAMIRALKEHPENKMVAMAAPINNEEDWLNPHITKVVMDKTRYCIYASRAPIPYSKSGKFHPDITKYYRNCGMYGFQKEFLRFYANHPETMLQHEEDLEQLKALEMGAPIKMVIVDHVESGVDLPEQIDDLVKIIEKLYK